MAPFGEFSPGGSGSSPTLASVYAFGLGDDPFNDNMFAMPGFNWRFPGALTSSGRERAADMLWQQKSQIDLASPPGARFTSVAFQNSGVGGSGCGNFETYQLRDPAWNGNLNSLSDFIAWQLENATITNDPTETDAAINDFLVWNRTLNQKGGSAPTWPSFPDPIATNSTQQRIAMNINADHIQDVEYLNGYGWHELHLDSIRNGAATQWVTHWRNFNAGGGSNGDGPAWMVDVDGRFGRFAMVAGINPYQRTSDVFGPWGVKLIGYDGAPAAAAVVVLDVTTDKQSGPIANGRPIPTTFHVGPLDITAIQPDTVIVPAVPGKRFVQLGPANGNFVAWQSSNATVGGAFTSEAQIEFKVNGVSVYTGFPLDASVFAAGVGGMGGDFISNAAFGVNQAVTVGVPVAAVGAGMVWTVDFFITGVYI